MANQDMVKSGFDMEVLFGKGFFGEILSAYRDADIFPNSIELFEGIELKLGALDLVFKPHLVIGMSFDMRLLVDNVEYCSGNTDIFFNFNFIPVRDSRGNISQVDIHITFNSFNNDKLDNFLSRLDNDPIHKGNNIYTSVHTKRAIRNRLNELLEFNYKTNLVTNLVQDVQVRTLSNPPVIGIYINFIMRKGPQPDNIYPARGDISQAENLLAIPTNIGIFIPDSVYPMLSTELKSSMAKENSSGEYYYPVYDGRFLRGRVIGRLTSLNVSSTQHLASLPLGFRIMDDPEQLLISMNSRIHYHDIDADANGWTTFKPIIENGKLKWKNPHLHSDIDVDWEDQLKMALYGGFFLGMFFGLPAIPLFAAAVYGAISVGEEMAEDIIEDMANGMISDQMDNLLGSIPESITIATKRLDPFYDTHYQIAGNFEEAKVNSKGMAFTADVRHKNIYPVYANVVPSKAIRNSENVLVGLVYKVPNSSQIINPENFVRPNPNRPDMFYLNVNQMAERLLDKKLCKRIYLKPTHVKKSGHRIKYIKFTTGIYLTPNEAGHLHQIGAIRVKGFQRIHLKKSDTYYYRGRRDRSLNNNLGALPTFEIKNK